MAGARDEARGELRPWQRRARHATDVMDALREVLVESTTAADEHDAERWLATVDPTSHVGSRHHYVPRFLLERWADRSGQVRAYSRIDDRFGVRNIRDLAIKDFYTFINLGGEKDSTMESLLGEIEKPVALVLRELLNPFTESRRVEVRELAALARFAAFQLVRTPRHRREQELQAEWLAKSMAQGQIADAQLREITVTPHQNDAIRLMGDAEQFIPLLACRPFALVVLDRPLLLIGDDPLLINAGPQDDTHHADCFMTDAEFEAKLARERAKKKGRRREQVSRIVHFRSTAPRGLGVAHEVVLPITPRAALLWGPLQSLPYTGDVLRERLEGLSRSGSRTSPTPRCANRRWTGSSRE